MKNVDERIAELQDKLKKEKAKKQKIDARKRAMESKAQRSQDTRKKILVGAAILALVESGKWDKDKLNAMLNASLTRADDRALFELDVKVGEQVPSVQDGAASPHAPNALDANTENRMPEPVVPTPAGDAVREAVQPSGEVAMLDTPQVGVDWYGVLVIDPSDATAIEKHFKSLTALQIEQAVAQVVAESKRPFVSAVRKVLGV